MASEPKKPSKSRIRSWPDRAPLQNAPTPEKKTVYYTEGQEGVIFKVNGFFR